MDLLKFTINLAKKAGTLAIKESKKITVNFKRKNDLVTNADKACEKLIKSEILKNFPDHLILAEESNENFLKDFEKSKNPKYIWIIDPIDGTTNYAHGLPLYSVSIGLFKITSKDTSKNFEYLEGEIVLGVVHAPALNETFYAQKGKGAYLNGKKITISTAKKLADSLMVTGFPYENKEMNLPYFIKMMEHCQAIRRLGSAALDLCYVAASRFDGYWEFDLKPWDVAAGALIVKEAGGKVTDLNGNLLDLFGFDILASNNKIHKEILETFSPLLTRHPVFKPE